jgi:uncharacterized damage-inducible protein DinB
MERAPAGASLSADFAVSFRDLMLQGLTREMQATKAVLASIPDAQRDYRPHPKSRTAWELAWHIAADIWFLEGVAELQFEMNPDLSHQNPAQTAVELAQWYENRFLNALSKVQAMSPQQLLTPVSLGGVAAQNRLAFPAFLYLLFLHQHTVHHRGQLSTYLRPMGSKVPNIYGPSADAPGTA